MYFARARVCVYIFLFLYESLHPVNTNATLRLDILLTHDSRNSESSRSKLKERGEMHRTRGLAHGAILMQRAEAGSLILSTLGMTSGSIRDDRANGEYS